MFWLHFENNKLKSFVDSEADKFSLYDYVESTVDFNPEVSTVELVDGIQKLLVKESSAVPIEIQVKQSLINASHFGRKMIDDFKVENVLIGITQEGLTGYVTDKGSKLLGALSEGSLYLAYEIINNPDCPDYISRDAKYFSDVRLSKYIIELETYLGMNNG